MEAHHLVSQWQMLKKVTKRIYSFSLNATIENVYVIGNIGVIKILIQNGAVSDVGTTKWLLEGIQLYEGLRKFLGCD